MTERDENIIAGIIVSSLLDYASKERLIEAMRADAEASRLSSAASPREEPNLKALAAHLGWGNNMSPEAVFGFVCERERLIRVAQDSLETQKSNASTAEAAIRERIALLKEASVPPLA